MAEQRDNDAAGEPSPAEQKPARMRKYNWDDPNVPAGDAPPMSRWPIVIGAMAWAGWLAFLLVMMVARMKATPV